jgi:hypothetical protein
MQGVKVESTVTQAIIAGSGVGFGASAYNVGGYNIVGVRITDGVNGTPREGKTTRGNLITTYVYLYGGQYVA